MTELDLYKFVHDNNCEYHWYDDNVILFVTILWIDEFNKLFDYSFFDDEGQECIMKKDYFCFWMQDICDYYDIEMSNIFTNKD